MSSSPKDMPPKEAAAVVGANDARPTVSILKGVEVQTSAVATTPVLDVGKTTEISAGITAGIWDSNKLVTSLWSINQNRNSWIGISDIGWRKLADNSDSAIVALTILGSHALQTGKIVSAREENGLVKEIYAW